MVKFKSSLERVLYEDSQNFSVLTVDCSRTANIARSPGQIPPNKKLV